MDFEAREDDLAEVLLRQSMDVPDAEQFLLRLGLGDDIIDPGRPAGVLAAVGVLVIVLVAAVATFVHVQQRPGEAAEGGRPARNADSRVWLSPMRDYFVSADDVRPDREILSVTYAPNRADEYLGATITRYARGSFDEAAFTQRRPVRVRDHLAYFGVRQHEHVLAWPLADGGWLCLRGFRGTANGTSVALTRHAELTVGARIVLGSSHPG